MTSELDRGSAAYVRHVQFLLDEPRLENLQLETLCSTRGPELSPEVGIQNDHDEPPMPPSGTAQNLSSSENKQIFSGTLA
eukprot:CAMPEP_0115576714 /NCGR_PEP_ID=MMETSP0272-20121206/2699_1 /TAXON_ID=71861 /ORGANISM="Scrippsiella trochoidea, Strain CCMP3099" /LENGTH=79 /DNA_ID=CAMNT_0003011503 /DNA_START=4 /DNA_END=244 /DNA_ORIENTATION=-